MKVAGIWNEGIGELSEYRVAPGVAPFFQVGELWAGMHARGLVLGELGPRQLTVGYDGRAAIVRALSVQTDVPLEPERMAADWALTLRNHPPEMAHALLTGYVRLGYEWVDHLQPGFTDAVLDVLQCPTESRPLARAMFDVPRWAPDLGADLRVVEGRLALAPQKDAETAAVWQEKPQAAFETLVALMAVGVDCRELYARDRVRTLDTHPLYRWLLSGHSSVDPEWETCLPGSELPFALVTVLRNSEVTEPYQLNDILFWLRKVLLEFPDERAQRFGDLLITVSLHCAALLDREGSSAQVGSQSFAQHAIIFLECTARGTAHDEARLIWLTRALYGLSWYPRPYQRWRVTQYQLGMWNSWLLTYRSLTGRSFEVARRTSTGPLRSAALRGLYTARRALPMGYRMAASPDPELAIMGLKMLRGFIKSHAILLHALWDFVKGERPAPGTRGWLPFFEDGSNPTPLASELAWSAEFLSVAAKEDFFFDSARQHLQAGAPFLATPDELDPAPPSLG